jgi:hypothetical protein
MTSSQGIRRGSAAFRIHRLTENASSGSRDGIRQNALRAENHIYQAPISKTRISGFARLSLAKVAD